MRLWPRSLLWRSVLLIAALLVLANLASLIAVCKFLSGERYASWEPIREPVARVAGGGHAATAVTTTDGRNS